MSKHEVSLELKIQHPVHLTDRETIEYRLSAREFYTVKYKGNITGYLSEWGSKSTDAHSNGYQFTDLHGELSGPRTWDIDKIKNWLSEYFNTGSDIREVYVVKVEYTCDLWCSTLPYIQYLKSGEFDNIEKVPTISQAQFFRSKTDAESFKKKAEDDEHSVGCLGGPYYGMTNADYPDMDVNIRICKITEEYV